MSGVCPVTSCNWKILLNQPDCVEALCMTLVVHCNPYYQIFLGTCFLIIVQNHCLRTSLINPSSGFRFGLSGLVLVNNISFLWQHFKKNILRNLLLFLSINHQFLRDTKFHHKRIKCLSCVTLFSHWIYFRKLCPIRERLCILLSI